MEVIDINTESIKIDQLLKWANIVSSGGQAKNLIKEGAVRLNGKITTSRGQKVFPGDELIIDGDISLKVTRSQGV